MLVHMYMYIYINVSTSELLLVVQSLM